MEGNEALKTVHSKSHEYENSIAKLFLHGTKCKNLTEVSQNKKEYDSSLPICIELHLTNLCNLDCEWCIDKHIRGNHEEIPLPSLFRLLARLEGSNVGLTIEGGGEPTMHSGFDKFILECYKRNISIGLITNGTNRLRGDIVKCFDFIRVSVDSSTPMEYIIEKGKDYFNDIIENIRFIRENSQDVILGLSYVLTNRNYQNLSRLFDLIGDIDINFMRLRNIEECEKLSLTESMMKTVQETINGYKGKTNINMVLSTETETNQVNNNWLPCIAHSLRSLIHANGDVVLCSKRRHDPIIIGNINNDDFLTIWNSEKRINATKKLRDRNSQQGCTVCRITKYNELFYNLSKVKSRNFI